MIDRLRSDNRCSYTTVYILLGKLWIIKFFFLMSMRYLGRFRLRRSGGLSGSVREVRFEIRGFDWSNASTNGWDFEVRMLTYQGEYNDKS